MIAAQKAAEAREGARAGAGRGVTGGIEKKILGVPERFMRPRIILLVAVAILCVFGLVMIYSASSVTAMYYKSCNYDAAYYLKHQAGYLVVGVVLAFFIARIDYHAISGDHLLIVSGAIIVLLVLVYVPGFSDNTYGASRWINIAGVGLQPSEFAKCAIIAIGAAIMEQYFVGNTRDWRQIAKLVIIGIVVPLALILRQPDKGTTMIIAATLVVMLIIAGVDWRIILVLGVCSVAFLAVLSLSQDYSMSRIQAFLDPWADSQDSSYQLVQGFYAFGSGGIFGVGIGGSKQKYAYLFAAYNDFIYAVIGEECGLVGTLGVVVGFAFIVWAGYRIARYAPDLTGRLIAVGCSSLLVIQMLVNVCGVLGLIPLTGKPIPFISYGGSSAIASLMLVGMIVSVSRHSSLPETEHDRARQGFTARGRDEGDLGLSYVGDVTPRSARGSAGGGVRPGAGTRAGSRGGFTVVDGGGGETRGGSARGAARGASDERGGYTRIDLGGAGSAADRLRRRDSGPRSRR